ncbi:spore coat protein [Eubacterium multiforme]|uniref:Spore coat protein CotF n=1 Tax=Eubacterium multiforme TaxID=83339 RepID=A0ABT9URF8_9FIRM|nr:spore coat protein [Eubacterium multiforme]MDQ0149087.1 spore coat protein CotF [Eubacterium multiforme]
MTNMIKNLIKDKIKIDDDIISNIMLDSLKKESYMYLKMTLMSTTIELRLLYLNFLNQIVSTHTEITKLSVHKEWICPYDSIIKQLADAYNESID